MSSYAPLPSKSKNKQLKGINGELKSQINHSYQFQTDGTGG